MRKIRLPSQDSSQQFHQQQGQQQQQQQQLSQVKPFGKYYCICTIVALMDLLAIILPMIANSNILGVPELDNSLQSQIGQNQFKDIRIISSDSQTNEPLECPNGYQKLLEYNFAGMNEFISCGQEIFHKGDPRIEQSLHGQTQNFLCTEHPEIKQMKFNQIPYGDNTNLLLCGKYLEKNIELKQSCSEHEVECSRLNNYESSICAESIDECPINDISFVSKEDTSSSSIQILSTSKTAYNKMPIVSFALVEGSIKCKSALTSSKTQRDIHWVFKQNQLRSNSPQSACHPNFLFEHLIQIEEPKLFASNGFEWLLTLKDLNLSSFYKYSVLYSRQIGWNPAYLELKATLENWNQTGWQNLSDLQIFFTCINIMAAFLIILTSWYSSPKNENLKIFTRIVQITILWVLFFTSILRYRRMFREIDHAQYLTSPIITAEVSAAHSFYKRNIDVYNTLMIVTMTISIFFAVMQKWYYTRNIVIADNDYVFKPNQAIPSEVESFHPFYDESQL